MPTGVYKRIKPVWNKGKKLSPRSKKTKEKISLKNTGKKRSEKTKQNLSKIHNGKHYSPKTEFKKGKEHWNWKGGKGREPYTINWTKTFRRSIRERDKYTCQICGKLQGDRAFDIHHLDFNPKNDNPDNLITLCSSCHRILHIKEK